MRPTLGPGASLPLDLAVDPIVAHIPNTTYTGHVVMNSSDRKMTIRDRADSIQKVRCPEFVLQLGQPPEECVSVHLPATNVDREELLTAHRTALKFGGMLTVSHPYLWDLAMMLERCVSDNAEKIVLWIKGQSPFSQA